MNCPNCDTLLQIINANYFCPSCRMYIGKVSTYTPPPLEIKDQPIVDKKGFVKHYLLKAGTFLAILFAIFYFGQNLIYLDFANGCYLTVVPSLHLEFSNSGVIRALKIIKKVSPENYKNICGRVNIINTNIACGGMEGGCFKGNQKRTIYVTAPSRQITWVAEVLAHEACHARQRYEGRPGDEDECYQVGLKVMQDITIY